MAVGIAGFDFQALNRKYISAPSNDATAYGVSIVRARSMTAYRCIGVYHLTKAENGGRHNVFVEVLDERGRRDRTPMLNWSESTDRPMKSKSLDKPDDEPAADVPMSPHDTVTIRINDGRPGGDSDSVGNLHTRHMEPGSGDVWGHNSFFLVFQKQSAIVTPPIDPPIDPPPPVDPKPLTLESLAAQVAELKRRLDAMEGD